jgi:hypothetical protein
MKTSGATIEDAVAFEAGIFAKAAESVSGSDLNLRSAVMQMALPDANWSINETISNREHKIADFLGFMPRLLRDSVKSDKK